MPFSISFQDPQWLGLLVIVPAVWWLSRRSMASLGGWKAPAANLLRAFTLIAVIVALAAPQWNRFSNNVVVAYLLDQSASILPEHRAKMLSYVAANVQQHRQATDRAAVIVFGREAAVEVPPVEFTPVSRPVETLVDQTATNLADALTKAATILPRDAARRVVIVSDGNENIGAAARESRALLQSGIGIDVVPAPTSGKQDISVESVSAPSVAKQDQPLEVRVVLNNQGADPAPIAGKLRIVRKMGGREEPIFEEAVTLPTGKTVKTFREHPSESGFYVYEARFVPDNPAEDRYLANNLATGYTDVRGQGRVLLVEDALHRGEFDLLAGSLRGEGLEMDVVTSDKAFSSLADLQRYDSVLLANVPRVAENESGSIVSFTNGQIEMLVRNTKQLGSGLVMIGGDRSFGAGGWIGTELEKAMPVDFQIKNAKVIPVGALALVIDRSGSMAGDKLALSLAAAREAIKMLGPRDFLTVVAFDTEAIAVVPLERKGTGRTALARVSRIQQGGGTDLYPGMLKAFEALQQADAAVKHMIVLTDGQTPEAEFERLCREMRAQKITVTGVAVGPDADRTLLAKIASQGGGKFYAVADPRNVPRIFMVEARRVATPVIRELSPPAAPQRVGVSELLTGIEGSFPPIAGFVQTSVKENSLVEVLLRSPIPPREKNATVLATWTYGLGKTAVLTTDAGHQWASAWQGWIDYDKFFSQLVRWSLRPIGGQGNYSIATQRRDTRTQVVIDAFDRSDEFLNQLPLRAAVVGPDLEPIPLRVEQTAAGRYTGEFDSVMPGSYFVTIATPEGSLLRAGINVGVSREYSDFHVNLPLLKTLAGGVPRGGVPGILVTAEDSLPFATPEGDNLARELNPFRRDLPPAVSQRDVWPELVVAASLLFFSDIFVRRVQLDLAGLWERVAQVVKSRPAVEATVTLSRLSARKAEIRERYREAEGNAVEELDRLAQDRKQVKPANAEQTPQAPQPADTMARLLAAKQEISGKGKRDR